MDEIQMVEAVAAPMEVEPLWLRPLRFAQAQPPLPQDIETISAYKRVL